MASVTHKLDRTVDNLSRKTIDLDQARDQMERERIAMTEKLEVTRKKL